MTSPMLVPALRFALVLSLVAGSIAGQPAAPGVFTDIVDVRVINLEVVVTDRDGIRVSGLAPSDFELYVDGEETPIDYFTEVSSGRALVSDAGSTAGVPSLSPGAPVGTSVLVFIDDFFSIANDRNRVLRALANDITLLGPEDRMAIVAFDGRRLEMLSSWSSSWPDLQRVLEEAAERPALGLQRLSEKRTLESDRRLFGRQVVRSLSPEERHYAEQLVEQVERSVSAAAGTLRGFANPPGRKVMMLLSGGWPWDPNEVLRLDPADLTDREVPGGPELLRGLSDTANRLGYTLYPVDVPGLQSDTAFSAERATPPSVTGGSGSFFQEANLHQTLDYLAQETGGEAMLNGRRLEALLAVSRDTRSYYWLGFSPQQQGDDRRHEIRIEVVRPGLEVRSRSDFLDLSRPAQVSQMVESALLFGNSPSPQGLPVEVGESKRAGIGRVEVPIIVRIPLTALTMVPAVEGFRADLELRIAVMDERGSTADIPIIPLILLSAEAPREGDVGRYETVLKLRKEKHDLVVAIYEPLTGSLFSSRAEVAP